MSESSRSNPNISHLPSGYLSSERLRDQITVDSELLPWLREPMGLDVALCQLQGGNKFYLASAVKTDDRLIKAAEGMTDSQKQITDNMFYSRIAGFVEDRTASNVAVLPNTTPDFPVRVMRNQGGQRVYFGVPEVSSPVLSPDIPFVLRLAVCDKNRQMMVMKVLSDRKGVAFTQSGKLT